MLTRLVLQDGSLIADTWQDCEEVVERNKRGQSEPHKSDWGQPIAEIPNAIIVQWLNEEWARGNSAIVFPSPEFTALIKRKLRDPDWAYLRAR